jgi:hypothetical protein
MNTIQRRGVGGSERAEDEEEEADEGGAGQDLGGRERAPPRPTASRR